MITIKRNGREIEVLTDNSRHFFFRKYAEDYLTWWLQGKGFSKIKIEEIIKELNEKKELTLT